MQFLTFYYELISFNHGSLVLLDLVLFNAGSGLVQHSADGHVQDEGRCRNCISTFWHFLPFCQLTFDCSSGLLSISPDDYLYRIIHNVTQVLPPFDFSCKVGYFELA